jgi:hypothetical protein
VRLRPLGTAATTGLLYQPRMIDGDCEATDGMKIGRGNRSTRRKPAPAPRCPPQSPHDLTRARTRTAAVANQRLTAWATARPKYNLHIITTLSFTARHFIIGLFPTRDLFLSRACYLPAYLILFDLIIPLWRPKCKLEDNIKMDLRETEWGCTDWINLAEYVDQRIVNTVIKLWVS